jgi:hypothetical protein
MNRSPGETPEDHCGIDPNTGFSIVSQYFLPSDHLCGLLRHKLGTQKVTDILSYLKLELEQEGTTALCQMPVQGRPYQAQGGKCPQAYGQAAREVRVQEEAKEGSESLVGWPQGALCH